MVGKSPGYRWPLCDQPRFDRTAGAISGDTVLITSPVTRKEGTKVTLCPTNESPLMIRKQILTQPGGALWRVSLRCLLCFSSCFIITNRIYYNTCRLCKNIIVLDAAFGLCTKLQRIQRNSDRSVRGREHCRGGGKEVQQRGWQN